MRAPYRHNRFQFGLDSLTIVMTLFVVLLAMFGWIKAGPGGSGFPQLPMSDSIHLPLLLSLTLAPLVSLVLAIVAIGFGGRRQLSLRIMIHRSMFGDSIRRCWKAWKELHWTLIISLS